jgi:hypothetical protein
MQLPSASYWIAVSIGVLGAGASAAIGFSLICNDEGRDPILFFIVSGVPFGFVIGLTTGSDWRDANACFGFTVLSRYCDEKDL